MQDILVHQVAVKHGQEDVDVITVETKQYVSRLGPAKQQKIPNKKNYDLRNLSYPPLITVQIQKTKPRWLPTLAKATILTTTLLMVAAEFILSTIVLIARKRAADTGIITSIWKKEMEWGFGQIIAPFSWAPLLLELGSAIVGTVYHGRDPTPRGGWMGVRDEDTCLFHVGYLDESS